MEYNWNIDKEAARAGSRVRAAYRKGKFPMVSTISKPRRRAAWKPSRRLTDYLFRVALPGRHHNLDSAVIQLMTIREVRV